MAAAWSLAARPLLLVIALLLQDWFPVGIPLTLAAVAATWFWSSRVPAPRGPVVWPGVTCLLATGLAAWSIAAIPLSTVLSVSIIAAAQWCLLPLGMVLAVQLQDHQRSWHAALVALGCVVAVDGAREALFLGQLTESVFIQRNAFAIFLVPPLCLAGVRFVEARAESGAFRGIAPTLLPGLAIFLLVFSLWISQSRGALLGGVAGALVILAQLAGRKGLLRSSAPVLVIVVAAVLTAALVPRAAPDRILTLPGEATTTILDLAAERDPSENPWSAYGPIAERIVIWSGSLEMLRDMPWYGLGAGTYLYHYPRYRHDIDTSAGHYAHNDPLQVALELGFPGLLLLVALAVGVFVQVLRFGREAPATRSRLTFAGLSGAVCAVAVHGLVSFNFFVLPMVLLVGFLLGDMNVLQASARPVRRRSTWSAARLARVAILLTATVLGGTVLAMDMQFHAGREAMIEGDLAQADRHLDLAAAFFPSAEVENAQALLYLEAAERSGSSSVNQSRLLADAAEALGQAARLNPWSAETLLLKGRHAQLRGDLDRASDAYRQALAMNPWHYRARLEWARFELSRGQGAVAKQVLEAGVSLSYGASPVLLDYARLLARLRREHGETVAADRLIVFSDALERQLDNDRPR